MSKKTILILVIILIIIAIGAIYWVSQIPRQQQPSQVQPTTNQTAIVDPKSCTYNIEGESVTLQNGYAEQAVAPGSASKTVIQYFGNEASGDFTGNGMSDIAFLLTQNSGGSGTFYYVAVAIASQNGCIGTNAILLGDRIAPQNTVFQNGQIAVNYADRKPNEPMTATPSVGVTRYFKVSGSQLMEVKK